VLLCAALGSALRVLRLVFTLVSAGIPETHDLSDAGVMPEWLKALVACVVGVVVRDSMTASEFRQDFVLRQGRVPRPQSVVFGARLDVGGFGVGFHPCERMWRTVPLGQNDLHDTRDLSGKTGGLHGLGGCIHAMGVRAVHNMQFVECMHGNHGMRDPAIWAHTGCAVCAVLDNTVGCYGVMGRQALTA
jgi:hypothetical protein